VTQPLEGVRVLDLAETQQGLLATKMLADMGADVVKIERVGEPRRGAPVDLGEPSPSSWEIAVESGKRSIAVAPRSAGAAELVLALALPWIVPRLAPARKEAKSALLLLAALLVYLAAVAFVSPQDPTSTELADMRYALPVLLPGAVIASISLVIFWKTFKPLGVVAAG